MEPIDKAFYDLTVAQRDAAWREIESVKVQAWDSRRRAEADIEALLSAFSDILAENYEWEHAFDAEIEAITEEQVAEMVATIKHQKRMIAIGEAVLRATEPKSNDLWYADEFLAAGDEIK